MTGGEMTNPKANRALSSALLTGPPLVPHLAIATRWSAIVADQRHAGVAPTVRTAVLIDIRVYELEHEPRIQMARQVLASSRPLDRRQKKCVASNGPKAVARSARRYARRTRAVSQAMFL